MKRRHPVITTERLTLREWADSDFPAFAGMNKDKEVMQYFPSVLTSQETEAMITRIKAHFDKHGFGLFALEKRSTGEFIGYTGFMIPSFESFFTPCVEIGWRLLKREWGNGYAREAAKACLRYGFETEGFEKIYSFTSAINARSEKVMQAIGMIKEAEFDHPAIAPGSPLCRHVLYKIEKDQNFHLLHHSY